MSNPSDRPDNEAARWFGRCDGGLTPAESAALADWLQADPRHAEAWARLERTAKALDRLAALRPEGKGVPDPDLPLLSPARRFKFVWRPVALAAAALAVAYLGWQHLFPRNTTFTETVSTEIGGLQKTTLPDGSVVELNTDTVLDISYTPDERRVRLVHGEAHFTVAKNPARPFFVSAGGINVRAVGTAFNVRVRPERIEVLVTEGRVRLDDPRGPADPSSDAAPSLLGAAQRATIPLTVGATEPAPIVVDRLAPAAMARLLAWQAHRLEFDPQPLREVVAEFNRYNRHRLVIGDEAAGNIKVGGFFRSDDHGTLVRLLESSFGIEAEHHPEETVLRTRR